MILFGWLNAERACVKVPLRQAAHCSPFLLQYPSRLHRQHAVDLSQRVSYNQETPSTASVNTSDKISETEPKRLSRGTGNQTESEESFTDKLTAL